MSDVDKRVVQFEFDNAKFERNVKQSMSTLDKLKDKLDFEEVSDSLDKVSLKFSALEIAAITALSNITNRVVDLGINIVKSLSVDNISKGWVKFNEKTMSVATMASQTIKIAGQEITDYAKKMEVINEQLEKLNWFTDETSYNFTDMVDNIGKFTAAGQDLDASVEAMMGIANWAALSGQNAATASRAMYQLAQALSKGYVQLIDYKSIQNANMDTQEFRKTVLDTAVAMGELTKQGENYITKTGSKFTVNQFTEELNSKWFTSGVLTKSLAKYSSAVDELYKISSETGLTASEVIARYGDEVDGFGLKAFRAAQECRTLNDALGAIKDAVSTGWMTTAEKVFGAYTQSKELWSDLSNELYDVFAEGGNFRNEVLSIWTDLEGRKDLFAHGGKNQGAFWNIYDSIIAIKDIIKDAWNDIFPKTLFSSTADQAKDIARSFKNFTENLKETTARIKETIKSDERLRKILDGLFSVLRLGAQTVYAIRYALDPIITMIKDLANVVIDFAADLGVSLTKTDKVTEVIFTTAQKLSNVLSKIIEVINPTGILRFVLNLLKSLYSVLQKIVDVVKKGFSSIGSVTDKLKNIFVNFGNVLKTFAQRVRDVFSSISFGGKESSSSDTGSAVNSGAKRLAKRVSVSREAVKDVQESGKALTVLERALEVIKPIVESIKRLATALIGLVSSLINIVSMVIENVSWIFDIISRFSFEKLFNWIKQNIKWVALAGLAILLAVKIYDLVWGIIYAVKGVAYSLNTLADAANMMARSKEFYAIAAIIKNIGLSLLAIAASFIIFKTISMDGIAKGLIVMVTLGAMLALFMKFAKNTTATLKTANKTGTSLMSALNNLTGKLQTSNLLYIPAIISTFSFGLLEIALAFKLLGSVNKQGLIAGVAIIGAIGAITIALMLLSKKIGKSRGVITKSFPGFLTLIGMAVLIGKFTKSLIKLSSIDFVKLIGPIIGIISLIASISLVGMALSKTSSKMGKSGDIKKELKSIGSILIYLSAFALAIKKLSDMDSGKLTKIFLGFDSMIIALTIMVGTLSLFNKNKAVNGAAKGAKKQNNLKTILGYVKAMAGLLTGFVIAVKLLQNVGVINMIAITGSMIAFFTAMTICMKVIGNMRANAKRANQSLTYAGAMAIMLGAFVASIKILQDVEWSQLLIASGVMAAFLFAFVGALALMSNIKSSPTKLLGFAGSIAILSASMILLATALLMMKTLNLGSVALGFISLAAGITVLGVASKILASAIPFMLGLSAAVAVAGLGLLTTATSFGILATALGPFVQTFNENFDTIINLLQNFVVETLLFVATLGDELTAALVTIIGSLLDSLLSLSDKILEVTVTLINMLLQTIIDTTPKLVEALVAVVKGLLQALKEIIPDVVDTLVTLITTVLQAIAANIKEWSNYIFDIIIGLIDSLIEKLPELCMKAGEAVVTLVHSVVDTIVYMVPELINAGFDLILGIIEGIGQSIEDNAGKVRDTIISFCTHIKNAFCEFFGIHSPSTMFEGFGKNMIEGLVNGIKNMFSKVKEVFSNLFKKIGEVFSDVFGWFKDLGSKVINNVKDGLESAWNGVSNFFSNAKEKISGWCSGIKDTVNNAMTKVKDWVGNAAETVANKAQDIWGSVTTWIGGAWDATTEWVSDTAQNVANGVSNAWDAVSGAVGDAAESVGNWFKNLFGIHSPSTVFEQYGEYMMEGLAIGISENSNLVNEEATKSMSNVISKVGETIDQGIDDDELTITPVLDLSNVEKGTRSISSMMSGINGRSLSVSGSLANSASSEINRGSGATINNQNGNVTNNNSTDNYYSTFNITTDNPEELARETDKILQRTRINANLAKGGAY